MNVYKKGTWLAENIVIFQTLEKRLMNLESRQDSIPAFNVQELLLFIRGAVNEAKRATNESETLVGIIKGLEEKLTEEVSEPKE